MSEPTLQEQGTTERDAGAWRATGVPERLGPYQLQEAIGWGGMGAVYAAVDSRSGERVAVKVLRTDIGISEQDRRRFHQEVEIVRELRHPGIVPVRDNGSEGLLEYLVMDLIQGRTLSDGLKAGVAMPWREAVELMTPVARAVAAAHERGFVHRDLKPGNVLLDATGRPYVTDFGVARAVGMNSSLTASGTAVGTPEYMSPEQTRGRHRDCGPASDVWSLGVMLYELLTGISPFRGETALDSMSKVNEVDPPSLRRMNADIPPGLGRIVMQCLAKRPQRRYADAAALAEDLERLQSGQAVAARSNSDLARLVRRLPNWVMATGVAAVIFSLALGLGWMSWRDSQRGTWVTVADWDFTDPEVDLDGLLFADWNLQEKPGQWPIQAEGMAIERGHWLWLPAIDLPADVRLDVEVQWGEQPDGLELCINSRREALAGTGLVPVGYSCQVAGWNGLIDFISRNEATEGRHTAGARHALTEGGTISRVGFYREDDQFVLEVAGREPIRQIYPLPITGEQLGGVGLRTFANGAVLRRLRVSRHVSGSMGSPLARGDALAMTGAYEVAAQEYQAIAAVHAERSIGAPALARAYLAYHQLGDRPLELAALRRRLAERYPESDYYRLVLEAEVLELWRQGQEAAALAHFDRISQRFGTSEVLLRCLDLRRSSLAPDLAQGFLERIARDRRLSVLDLHGLGLVDCSPIQDLPLVWLDLGANPIADISTLRGMPLRRLSLAHTRVSDLRPLAGKPLMLHLSGCPVTTLRGLEGTPLIELWADESGLDDLSALTGNDTLQKLNLSATGVQDLSPLRAAPLSEFYASGSQVADLEPLSGKPLKEVYLDGTGVSDISPIANPELRILSMRELGIASIEPLRQVPRLRQLDVTGNRLTDLEVLQGKPLEFLSCRDNRIADMAVLAAFDRLQLICHQNPITSLGWMLDAPPERLRVPPLEALPEAELERGLAAWGVLRPELAMYCATRLAWLRDAPALAFAHALPREGQRIAILAEPMPLDAAQALATAWGGELIVPDGAQAISSLRRLASGSDRLWTGLVKLEGGALAAVDGRPVSLTGSSVHGAAGPILLWEWDALHVVEPAYRAWPVIVWSR